VPPVHTKPHPVHPARHARRGHQVPHGYGLVTERAMDRRPFWIIVPAATMLLGLIFWPMRALLTPVLAALALGYVLWPYRESEAIRRLLIAVGLLLCLWILARARTVVYPALAALAFAFLLDPVVDRLQRRGVARSLAALVLMLPLVGFGLLIGFALMPALFDQAGRLIAQLPAAYQTVRTWLLDVLGPWLQLQTGGVDVFEERFAQLLPSTESVLKGVLAGVGGFGRGVAAVVQVFSFLLLTPILTYYILVDFSRLRETARPYVSAAWAERIGRLGEVFQESVGAWLKGQLLVALILGVLTIIGFLLIGLPYALLLGCLAGLLNMLPVLGFWLTFVLALTAALFSPAPGSMLLKATAVMLVLQVLEGQFLSPRIVGRQLGVKPVVLLLTMLMLSVFLGVLGLLVAAPVIGLARAIWVLWGPRPRRPVDPEPQA
jgi:predicted PurR-regulated permease PerM